MPMHPFQLILADHQVKMVAAAPIVDTKCAAIGKYEAILC
jgi:hypothetical protein